MDKKISQLTGATTPLTGTEELAIVQGGSTVKATAQDVADLAGGNYLVYTALLTQTGTSAPTVLELTNTIGITLNFTRSGAGFYSANVGPAPSLDFSKSIILLSSAGFAAGGPTIYTNCAAFLDTAGLDKTVRVTTYQVDSSGNSTASDFGGSNRPLYLEIRVYP